MLSNRLIFCRFLLLPPSVFPTIRVSSNESVLHIRWSKYWYIPIKFFKSKVTEFIFLGSKITADSDCSHKIKRCLLPGRKAMTNWGSILKKRDITLPTKVCIVRAMVFSVVMYGYESWTIKKAEGQSIYAFELWCWRRHLRVPWTARRSN